MATPTKTNAPIPFAARLGNRVRRLRPRMMLVNERQPQQGPPPNSQIVPVKPLADGYIFPREQDAQFDAAIRIQSIAPGTAGNPNVVIQDVFTVADRLKGGWISALGYEYNNPHGFFQVQTAILINGGTPANYHFRNVDSVTGIADGSFPVAQIGTIMEPTPVRISLPSNGLIQIRAANFSQEESFSLVVRLKGWSFGN